MSEPTLPVAFTEGRGRTAGLLVVSIVLAVGSWMVATDGNPLMWAGVALFGLGIPLMAWSLVNPQQLVLDAEGVTATSPPNRRTHLPWSLVERFEVVDVPGGPGGAGRMVGFHVTPDAHQLRPELVGSDRARSAARGLAGVDGSFPSTNCYGQDPDELLDLLEQLRARHGGPSDGR